MNVNIGVDMRTSLGLARRFSPEDTGNVKFNATKAFMTSRGFRINYSLADAYYIYFLEEGTKKSTRHQGYIGNKTVPAIANFLQVKYAIKDKKQTKRIYGMAWNGNQDRSIESKSLSREQRNLYSQSLDLNQISNIQGKEWEHDTNIENNSDKWKGVDYLG